MSSNLIIRIIIENKIMKLILLRIENRIVTCQLEDGTIIDIARRWFTDDIQEGDTIEFSVHDCKNNE